MPAFECGRIRCSMAAHATPLTVVFLSVLALALAPVTTACRPAPHRPEDLVAYREALSRAATLEAAGDIEGAIIVWEEFMERTPARTATDLARSAVEMLLEKYERHVQLTVENAVELGAQRRYAEATALLDDTLLRFPRTEQTASISKLRKRLGDLLKKQREESR